MRKRVTGKLEKNRKETGEIERKCYCGSEEKEWAWGENWIEEESLMRKSCRIKERELCKKLRGAVAIHFFFNLIYIITN